jgi:NADPH:quinone reductase-like Zn-dependent oxidoreductase
MDKIIAELENGHYRVIVGKVFPLQEAAAAHSFLLSRKAVGKIVLTS